MKNHALKLAVCAALLATAAIAWADRESYRPISPGDGTVLDYRTNVSSDDSDDLEAPLNAEAISSNPNIAISARFSTESATVACQVILYAQTSTVGSYTLAGISDVSTLTGSWRSVDAEGYYIAHEVLTADLKGATHYDVRLWDISGGSVTLKTWTYGSESAGAGE